MGQRHFTCAIFNNVVVRVAISWARSSEPQYLDACELLLGVNFYTITSVNESKLEKGGCLWSKQGS